ncbi:RYamide neuropeptides-like [Hyposmocoma kahamanoa]|uniref:RYamide neuropeptides-like n=1 Tax=Hyposmocoma kahamanoa TaxID=1477025 RepID=UPI000E6D6541|nr:RYamide neuropeptides-like [Hyposmocoma kahamanoa]
MSISAKRDTGSAVTLMLCACAALVAVTSVDASKKAELAPAPFVMGSRYGRSPPRLLSPRNDRFFMGSRYGKRSEPLSTLVGQGPRSPATATSAPLVCDYTGISTLFHCRPAPHSFFGYRSMNEDQLSSEED